MKEIPSMVGLLGNSDEETIQLLRSRIRYLEQVVRVIIACAHPGCCKACKTVADSILKMQKEEPV
jgi:hypothetical protein